MVATDGRHAPRDARRTCRSLPGGCAGALQRCPGPFVATRPFARGVAEKPAQAKLQRQLNHMRSHSKFKCVQAYDPRPLADARAGLDRLNCKELETARATPEFERAFVGFFGASPVDPTRTSLPSLVLLGPDGVEIGRAQGALLSQKGQSYWGDAVTQQFIGTLDRLLLEG
jgi:hypothetical protein